MEDNDRFMCINQFHSDDEKMNEHVISQSRRIIVSLAPCDPVEDPNGNKVCSVVDLADS
jgi:hypothetical protein